MNLCCSSTATLDEPASQFLAAASWGTASCEPLTGDASARKYSRLRQGRASAVLMDASRNSESVAPFVRLSRHLDQLGFSAPAILARDDEHGLLLLEDFGDANFARLLESGEDPEQLYTLATDALIALHRHSRAIPDGWRAYDPERMLSDIELFLEWRAPAVSEKGKEEFRAVWREVLPKAQRVPVSLLLRDYHVANLMLLADRPGIRQAGLLDFQDAYQGPVTYDLASLLEDARRDVSEGLQENMRSRYLAQFPGVDAAAFATSMAVVAAQRHTRVLAIFERLSRRDGKHDYRKLHSPRVERLLHKALEHPVLAGVSRWMDQYAR